MIEERVERLFGLMFSWFSGYMRPMGVDISYMIGTLTLFVWRAHFNVHVYKCITTCVEESGLVELRYCTSRLCCPIEKGCGWFGGNSDSDRYLWVNLTFCHQYSYKEEGGGVTLTSPVM